MQLQGQRRNTPVILIAIIGIVASVLAPAGLAAAGFSSPVSEDSTVGGDSSVGDDSSVGEDSSPVADPVIRFDISVTNSWGGDRSPDQFPIFFNGRYWQNGAVVTTTVGGNGFRFTPPPGYSASSVGCHDTTSGTAIEVSIVNFGRSASFSLSPGSDVTCALAYEDDPVRMSVDVYLTNNDGGTSDAGDVQYLLDGAPQSGYTFTDVTAGTHTIDTSDLPGYRLAQHECFAVDLRYPHSSTRLPVIDGSVDIDFGYNLHCALTFDDLGSQPNLTVTARSNFGYDIPGVSLFVDSTPIEAGVSTPSTIGAHSISYLAPPGFSFDRLSCSGLATSGLSFTSYLDADVSCFLWFVDDASELQANIDIRNGAIGTLTERDVSVSLNGVTIPLGAWSAMPAGEQTISFTQVDGFVESVSCVVTDVVWPTRPDRTIAVDVSNGSGTFTTAADETASCTVLYNANPSQIRATAILVNEFGETDYSGIATVDGSETTLSSPFLVNPGSYEIGANLSEGDRLVGVSCVDDATGVEVALQDGVVDVGFDMSLTCMVEVTNPPHLSIDNASFDVYGNDLNAQLDGVAFGERFDDVLAPGRYRLTFTPIAGHLASVSCSSSARALSWRPRIWNDGVRIRLSSGDHVECELSSTPEPATITLDVSITNDHGGTATADDATVRIDGRPVVIGDGVAVGEGSHRIWAGRIFDYSKKRISCRDADTEEVIERVGQAIEVVDGQNVVCTVIYNDRPARVSFLIDITNDDGGTALATTPRIDFGPKRTRHGQFRRLSAGSYELGAKALAGYELLEIVCDRNGTSVETFDPGASIDANIGDRLTCTYYFDDVPS